MAWAKGVSGNPKGKPKGIRNASAILESVIKNVEGSVQGKCSHAPECKTFGFHYVRTAFENPKVAIALGDKLWARKVEHSGSMGEAENITAIIQTVIAALKQEIETALPDPRQQLFVLHKLVEESAA